MVNEISTPAIFISGQVYSNQTIAKTGTRQVGVQEFDIIKMVKSSTKYAVMITKPNEIKYHLEKAYYLSTQGRPGPVWIDIPANIQNANVDESIIKVNEAVILSMTKEERLNPKIISGSRKKRISGGSGVDIATVNKLLKQFKMMTNMMKKMSKGDHKGGMPPEIFNQLK